MQKKLQTTKKRLVSLPALGRLILCGALYALQFGAYYNGSINLSHVLLSMQFPFIQGVAGQEQLIPPDASPSGAGNSQIKIEVQSSGAPEQDLSGKEPQVLIYHTHATEAYFKTEGYDYKDNCKWRTLENDKNVVAVGEKLACALRSYGFSVLHDITNHEPPKLATSYSRSVVTMEKYKKKYPSLTMFIDVHRDSYGENPKEISDFVIVDGKECARMTFVVGTGKGATGTGYKKMPDFEANFALAEKLTETLRQVNKKFMRDIRVKSGRYNQHISNQCLLVEIGHNANTLEQALNSVDYLAEAIAKVAGDGGDTLPLSP